MKIYFQKIITQREREGVFAKILDKHFFHRSFAIRNMLKHFAKDRLNLAWIAGHVCFMTWPNELYKVYEKCDDLQPTLNKRRPQTLNPKAVKPSLI